MSRIVAGRFEDFSHAEEVLRALSGAGFQRSDYQSFFVNPPGQHATFPVGGDSYSDEGARGAGRGALRGALGGGVIGLAAGAGAYLFFDQAITILAGIGLGAYMGSLVGALSRTRAGSRRRATAEHPVERPAGYMVAVRVDRPGTEQPAIETLQRHGARDIERTEGEWRAGDWKDFDPRQPIPPNPGVPSESVIRKVTAEKERKAG
jgi:hypothetical protein